MAPIHKDPVLLHHDKRTHSATLTLNDPKKGNAFSPELQALFLRYLNELERDHNVHSIVITGAGEKFFCTGMNLSSGGSATSGDPVRQYEEGKTIFQAVDRCSKPTIALVNGACYGGGNGLAMACDLRISVENAQFNLSEVRRGLVPAIISEYLIREMGPALARRAMLTAVPLTPRELESAGVVYSVHATHEEARKAVEQLCQELALCAPGPMSTVKQLVRIGHAGSEGDEARRNAFIDMMAPSEEAMHGIGEWRKKKVTNWAQWRQKRAKAKL